MSEPFDYILNICDVINKSRDDNLEAILKTDCLDSWFFLGKPLQAKLSPG